VTNTRYNDNRRRRKRAEGRSRNVELVAIPHVRALSEIAKALRCEFGDDDDHSVPKSQIADQSEVKREGDRSSLLVPKCWAEKANVMHFVTAPSPSAAFRNFRYRLQELHLFLNRDDPAPKHIKTLCDALREDIGVSVASQRSGAHGSNG
jgi:hypothetical protein